MTLCAGWRGRALVPRCSVVEPAGRYPCCLRSPPVAGRRPLGVSRERRYHRTIQPRTHACRYGERHHQDVAGLTSLMSHSSLRAPIVPTVRLRRVSRPSGFQRQGRRERGPTGLWSPSRSHSMSLFCGSPFACPLELEPRRHARNRHGQLYCEHQRNHAGSEFGHEVVVRRDGGEAC